MKILTVQEIRDLDRRSTEEFGIPGILLMENAGIRVVETLESRIEDLEDQTFVILCGKGNNAGDGFVVARQLIHRGLIPSVFMFASPERLAGDARTNLEILTAIGYPPVVISNRDDWDRERAAVAGADVVVDALFGTGLSGPLEGLFGSVVASLRDDFPRAVVVSVDIPSGCLADTAILPGPAVEADLTVTLSAPKFCLVFPPAGQMAGEVVIADIGNPCELVDSDDHEVELLLPDMFPGVEGLREDDTNKGNFGKVLIVGGSRGKSGAVAMAGEAALRAGAGLVTVAVPEGSLPVVAGHMAELMTEPLPETDTGTLSMDAARLDEIISGKSIVAIGPGLGSHPETTGLISNLLEKLSVPVVLDADGLNAFAGDTGGLLGGNPIVITPHPGEMARLLGIEIAEVLRNRLTLARNFALNHGLYVVLKGFRTVVACPDGRAFVNPTGNAGMATAGSGDVLTGMIAGILGQSHLGAFDERLCLAVYLHGLAGDIAAAELGEEYLTATDLIGFLPEAWAEVRDE